ncbi:MAG: hypothetical protein GY745_03960 [Actinomycetia bacterium]|jgi:hypothetical protein|nr:hypothetical protein [Actinomycetes bacterium]
MMIYSWTGNSNTTSCPVDRSTPGNGVVYLIDAVLLPTPSAVSDGAGAGASVDSRQISS